MSAYAAYAAVYASAAARAARVGPAAARAVARDFDLLRHAASEEAWTDDTPVPPSFFGTLWPGGVPEGWPIQEESSEGLQLEFELDVPEGVSDEEVYARAVELAGHADDLHRSYGGRGLKIKSIEVLEESRVREGVPS